ncbi:MAG TPA: alpha-amylase family glycosyl hydrolase [Acetobacteraceae bacterium]|jgi:alpha-amylase|nr:alpha-amylase family glycosyl hydrolase [Acetobacteraceae bacterium]
MMFSRSIGWRSAYSIVRATRFAVAALVFFSIAARSTAVFAQAGFEDDRVMLQGFYWESSRHGYRDKFPQFGSEHWYAIIAREAPAIRAARFDLVWLPPPSFAGGFSAGYDPKEYFNLDNSYGSFAEHRAALAALLANGVEPVADIVINHRNGSHKWADFNNPAWGTWAITRDDEAFNNPASEVFNTPIDQRGAPEESPAYRTSGDYAYDAFRDLDHTNLQVRRDIVRYLLQLKSLGYRGWRFDMVHGYNAKWIAVYNRATAPSFVVGEYDWDKQDQQRGWVWFTATSPGGLTTSSDVFDFSSFFTLKDNKGRYGAWYGFGQGVGLVGDNSDGRPWKNRSVTFVENHDTGFRTNGDGTPQDGHTQDNFANGWEVEQAYAQILTHPGVPTVYWKHYFDWGQDLQDKIHALINARKAAGVHAGSALYLQDNARQSGIYAARVVGHNGDLYVRIGGDDGTWQPSNSGYADYREYAAGTGWKVWVGLAGNPDVQQMPGRTPFAVPEYQAPDTISVPDDLLN